MEKYFLSLIGDEQVNLEVRKKTIDAIKSSCSKKILIKLVSYRNKI